MTKHDSIIRLAEKPYKMIKWLTENYKFEVCAFGIGEVVDGEMYIEKLIFPKQRVNSVHVEFDPGDWGSLFPQMEGDEMDRIIFYWHKHPGNPTASSDDETNTFDTLMDEAAGRKIFGFLQTAISGSEFKYEARIEVRDPVRATIMTVLLETDADCEIEEECQKMVKKYCVEPAPYVTPKYTALTPPSNIKTRPADNAHNNTFPPIKDLLLDEGTVCNVVRYGGQLYITVIRKLDNWIEDEIGEFINTKALQKYYKDTLYIPGCTVFKCYGHGKDLKHIAKTLRTYLTEFNMNDNDVEEDATEELDIQEIGALEEMMEEER